MGKYMPIILIIVSIAVFFMVIDPKYAEVKELRDQKERNDETLVLSKKLRERRDSLQQRFNNISDEEKDHLIKLIPETVDNVRLILDINNIAEEYGIIIKNIDVETQETVTESTDSSGQKFIVSSENAIDNIGTITLAFSVSATYDVFIDFMTDLEQALRIVDIKEMGITVPEEGDFYDFSVKLNTYWLR